MDEWMNPFIKNKTGKQTSKNSFPSPTFGSCSYLSFPSRVIFFSGFHPSNFYEGLVSFSKSSQIQDDPSEIPDLYALYLSDQNHHHQSTSFTFQKPRLHPDSSFSLGPNFKIQSKPFHCYLLKEPPLHSSPFVPVCHHSIPPVFKLEDWNLLTLSVLHAAVWGIFSKCNCDHIAHLLKLFSSFQRLLGQCAESSPRALEQSDTGISPSLQLPRHPLSGAF